MRVIVAGKEVCRGREVIASIWAESGPDSAHFLFLDLASLSSMCSYVKKGH